VLHRPEFWQKAFTCSKIISQSANTQWPDWVTGSKASGSGRIKGQFRTHDVNKTSTLKIMTETREHKTWKTRLSKCFKVENTQSYNNNIHWKLHILGIKLTNCLKVTFWHISFTCVTLTNPLKSRPWFQWSWSWSWFRTKTKVHKTKTKTLMSVAHTQFKQQQALTSRLRCHPLCVHDVGDANHYDFGVTIAQFGPSLHHYA